MFHNSCPPLDTHPSSRGHVRKHGAVLILIFSGAWRPENTENSALKSTSSEEKVSLQTQTRHQKEVQHPPAGTKTEFRWTATKGKFPFRKKVLRALISAWSGERYLRCIFVQCRGLWLEPLQPGSLSIYRQQAGRLCSLLSYPRRAVVERLTDRHAIPTTAFPDDEPVMHAVRTSPPTAIGRQPTVSVNKNRSSFLVIAFQRNVRLLLTKNCLRYWFLILVRVCLWDRKWVDFLKLLKSLCYNSTKIFFQHSSDGLSMCAQVCMHVRRREKKKKRERRSVSSDGLTALYNWKKIHRFIQFADGQKKVTFSVQARDCLSEQAGKRERKNIRNEKQQDSNKSILLLFSGSAKNFCNMRNQRQAWYTTSAATGLVGCTNHYKQSVLTLFFIPSFLTY